MYKYIKSYNLGYNEGVRNAINDRKKNKIKRFKKVDDKLIMAKLYDVGYINGYNKFIKRKKT